MRTFRFILTLLLAPMSQVPCAWAAASVSPPPLGSLPCAAQDAGRANLATTMEYDAAGQLAKTTAPDGRVSEYGYDANGDRVSESVTAGGVTFTTRAVYDAMRRVVRVTGPDGLATAYEHDAPGRVVRTVADAEGEKIATLNAFDAAGRLVKTVADAGGANESATAFFCFKFATGG